MATWLEPLGGIEGRKKQITTTGQYCTGHGG